MFWRQRFYVKFNVRVAVNVTTNMSVTHVTIEAPPSPPATKALNGSGGGLNAFGHHSGHGGISLFLIINLLCVLLLALCCDVCKSNENPLNAIRVGAGGGNGSFAVTTAAPGVINQFNTNLTLNANAAAAAATLNDTLAANVAAHSSDTLDNVRRACLARCLEEENVFQDEFGIKCADGDDDSKCFKSRCAKGCEKWWQALKEFEPCDEACSSTQFYPFDLPCISACEMAQRHYWHLQRLALESLVRATAPTLLNESLTAHSVTIQWPIQFPDNYVASRPFNIQYRYIDVDVQEQQDTANVSESLTQWYNLVDYNCNENYDCEILDGLMPFTSYRLRFELPFGDSFILDDVLYSPASAVFRTLAAGAPLSAPIIESVIPMDHTHLALFWQAGKFTNGPLTGFKLFVSNTQLNTTQEVLLPATQAQYIFDELLPGTNYTLRIAMLNDEGEGPFAETSILTPEQPKVPDILEHLNLVLIAGEYTIRLKSLEPLAESTLIFQSEQLISDYDVHMATQRLFVIDATGAITSLFLNDTSARTLLPISKDLTHFKPTKITVDWLNQRLFIAGMTPTEKCALATTNFDAFALDFLATELPHTIQQILVDPINGWLFWTQTTGLGITRMNLAQKTLTILQPNTQIGYFTNDFERYLLIAYNKSDNALYELSYDGVYSHKLIANSSSMQASLQGEWQSFSHYSVANILFATNGTHLMRQNYHTNENDNWHNRDLEWCWHVLPLQQHTQQQQQQLLQPSPMPHTSPSNLQALLTANMAQISWQAPARNTFQTALAWQLWEYELEIMDVASNSAFNIRNIKTTFFNVEKLQANNLYKLRVRAILANRGVAGVWSESLLTRTWPLGAHKFWWAAVDAALDNDTSRVADAAGLYETTETGSAAVRVGAIANLRNFVQLNGTVFYLTQDQQLRCVNIMNPELNCTFAATHAVSLAYDWRGGKLYWTDVLRNCVIRANLDGSARELLPIFGTQDIRIDAYNGQLYYTTGARLARRTLNGAYESEEVEYFHVNGLGGMIRGFALNLLQQKLYWIVRQHEGHVRLFSTSLERSSGNAQKLHDTLLRDDIELGTLEYLPEIESLMWLQPHSNKMTLLRTDNLAQAAHIEVPDLPPVLSVHLKSVYTPFADESVMPSALNVSSIRIDDGYWDDFNIKWTSITTAENHTVYYKVLLQYGNGAQIRRFYTMEVQEPFIRITEFHQPQLLLNVSITPHTYWHAGATVHTQLRTPAAAPTQPKRLRIFVQRNDKPLETTPNISALIRWDPPENVSLNAEVSYKVYCWLGEALFAERLHNLSSDNDLEAVIDGLRLGETYTFQVQAFAAGRASGGEKTAFHALHINPEVQAVPRLLFTTADYIAELDLDLNSRRILVHTASEVEHLVVLLGEQRLLWVNENVELISFVPHSAPVKLARMRAEVLALTVDWIARIVYWAEMDKEREQAVSIYKLDLCQFEGRVMLGSKVLTTEQGRHIKDLKVLPFSQTLLWLEYELGARNATLAGYNLTENSTLSFKSMALLRLFDGARNIDMETVNLVDFKGKMCGFDVQRQLCQPLKVHFNMVTDGVLDVDRDAGYIYGLKNDSIRAYNRRKQNLDYVLNITDVRRIKAYNYQHYPQRKCLLPDDEPTWRQHTMLQPKILTLAEHYVTFNLPPVNTDAECWLRVPGVKYMLQISDAFNNTRNFTSHARALNVTQLAPFTNYTVALKVSTYYQQKMALPLLEPEPFSIRTAEGIPFQPENFSAYALSPTEIYVKWLAPVQLNCAKVWYQLHWQMENSSLAAYKNLDDASLTLSNLEPSHEYTIWLKVFSTESKFNTTAPITVRTYDQPGPLALVQKTAYNLTVTWVPTPNLTSIILVCHDINGENDFSIDITKNTTNVIVPNLEPKTRYELHFELSYNDVIRPYSWPEQFNERFVYETLGDSPSSPGQPQIEHIAGEIFKVFWEPARNNGAPIIEYSLEALQARNMRRRRREAPIEQIYSNKTITILSQLPWVEEPSAIEDQWMVYCNTTELSCIVRELHTMRFLMFRVRARNEPYGWGPYSDDSERIFEPFVSPEKRDSLVFAIIAPAVIVSSFVIILVAVRKIQKRRLKAKKLLEKSRPSIWSNLSTLQQQQLMASRNRTFSIASHSTLYTGGPLSDADIALLPQIKWSQITWLNFLGSGAFGEVYEGLIKYDDVEEPEKVAIKSLRKGASEFSELLQEAQLMSNFKHENIVRLVGVCFETESISIIMEHMEGGDLLTYLRESRTNSGQPLATLQLLDLLTMCIDVATGCSYLEDMHFVHRDLACRNCLVSSRVPSKRVVKIGDFGLARDIYKHDYYRKEGEGLLPVRWMAPESLVDGVFTTQSDVWAFAVLCWEILTLGQQPYVARNNFEVLSYVKDGGRLEQPEICPDKLYAMLLYCWHSDPDDRPTFRKCLNILLSIKTDVRRVSLGYTMDDDADYAMYANHYGVVLSSFLANPLPKVVEEDDVKGSATDMQAESTTFTQTLPPPPPSPSPPPPPIPTAMSTLPDKTELKVRFEDNHKDIELEVASDEAQLLARKKEHDDDNANCYVNEGVSRL